MIKRIMSVILVTALVCLNLISCSSEIPENQREVLLYFSDSSAGSLVTETAYIDESVFDNVTEFAETIVNKLIDGPKEQGHISVIPKGVFVRGISMGDESATVNIDLGGPYYSDNDDSVAHELMARYSITKTLCQSENIKRVKFYINGSDMKSNHGNGEILSALSGDSIIINSPSSVETQTEKFVTLYFSEKSTGYLQAETRKATMADNSLENTVVSELLRGPVDDKLERTIPESVTLISIETTEDICFVNFSSNFKDIGSGSSKELKLAVYSVVNSLTRLPGIDKVQILVDGKKPEKDTQQLFTSPLERDESLISDKIN